MKNILLVLSLLIFSSSSLFAADKPNIIFILADDLAQGDLGCYGQKLIKTPRLDQLATAGTRYTQAYAGTSVCAPSRTSVMTGLHMGHSPVRANREIKASESKFGAGQFPLPESTVTVAQLLKTAGYATACMGKWGMGQFDTTGSPLKKGFDHFFGYNGQVHAHDYFTDYLFNDENRIELNNKNGKKNDYAQNYIADESLRWIKEHKDHPFFFFYAVTLPHGKYEIDDLGIYKDKDWTEQEKTYAAMVTRLDSDVGRIVDLLQELKLDKKTLIIFVGDNGSSFAPDSPLGKRFEQAKHAGGVRGFKRGMYEGGLRQAAITWWPGTVPAGRVSDEPWAFWDFLPTACELADVKIPAAVKTDGKSLVSFFKGGNAPQRDYFYWELHEANKSIQAIRFGNWKAVRNNFSEPLELYDLKNDQAESNNLAASKPEIVKQAEEYLKTARTEDHNWPIKIPPKNQPKKNQNKKQPANT